MFISDFDNVPTSVVHLDTDQRDISLWLLPRSQQSRMELALIQSVLFDSSESFGPHKSLGLPPWGHVCHLQPNNAGYTGLQELSVLTLFYIKFKTLHSSKKCISLIAFYARDKKVFCWKLEKNVTAIFWLRSLTVTVVVSLNWFNFKC